MLATAASRLGRRAQPRASFAFATYEGAIIMAMSSTRILGLVTVCALAGCSAHGRPAAVPSPQPAAVAAAARSAAAAAMRAARQKTAFQLLRYGRPREARRLFERDAAYHAEGIHTFGYTRLLEGLFLSDLYAKDDAAAAKDLARAVAYVGREPAGDEAIFRGDDAAAWRAYAAASLHQPGYEMDPVVAAGARDAGAGNLTGALATWSGVAGGAGGSYGADLQYALVGIADARLERWRDAERAWLLGAVIGRPASVDRSTLWDGNLTSLAMLYHYRSHLQRGENAYRWPLPAVIGVYEDFERRPSP